MASKKLLTLAQKIFVAVGLALALGLSVGFFLEAVTRIYARVFIDYDLEMWKYAKDLKTRVSDERGHVHQANKEIKLMGVKVETDTSGRRLCGFANGGSLPLLAFIGDSLTFGWGVEASDSFPCLIGKSYLSKTPQARVLNFGVGNYNIEAILKQYQEEVFSQKPETVVWGFYINDIELNSRQASSWLSQHSMFYVWLRGIFYRFKWLAAGDSGYEHHYSELYQKNREPFLAAVQSLQTLSKQNGSRFLVVMLPDLNTSSSQDVDRIYDDIESSLREIKIEVLNLNGHTEWKSPKYWVSRQDSHPNKIVHQYIFKYFCENHPEICQDEK